MTASIRDHEVQVDTATTNSSLTFTKANLTGLADGDTLIFFGAKKNPGAITPASGFSSVQLSTSGSIIGGVYINENITVASEPSTWVFSWASAQRLSGIMIAIQDGATASIVDVSGKTEETGAGGDTTIPAPTVTTTADNELVIRFFMGSDCDILTGNGPGGETELALMDGAAGSFGVFGVVTYFTQVSAGATGVGNLTTQDACLHEFGATVAFKSGSQPSFYNGILRGVQRGVLRGNG